MELVEQKAILDIDEGYFNVEAEEQPSHEDEDEEPQQPDGPEDEVEEPPAKKAKIEYKWIVCRFVFAPVPVRRRCFQFLFFARTRRSSRSTVR
ncbi:MAG TPA: hypothetical protein V6C97_05535 [Oculatellaceae cyanobacterium]